MQATRRTSHSWAQPAHENDQKKWRCRRCPIVVTAPRQTTCPSDEAAGRTVNGQPVASGYVLPSCNVYRVPLPEAPTPAPRLRKLPPDPEAKRDHELRTCYDALGKSWVNATIGERKFTVEGDLDAEWELALLQLYSAVRILDLEAVDLIQLVYERMRTVTKQRVGVIGTLFKVPLVAAASSAKARRSSYLP